MAESGTLSLTQFARQVLSNIGVEAAGEVHGHTGLFDDLDLDSLQALQLMFAVEAMSGTDVPPPDLPEIFTLGDAYDYYLELVAAQP